MSKPMSGPLGGGPQFSPPLTHHKRPCQLARERAMARDHPSTNLVDWAKYRICILGNLDAQWSDYCGGMTIEQGSDSQRSPMTILTGCLAGQCVLIGVLNSLHDLGYLILSIECVGAG